MKICPDCSEEKPDSNFGRCSPRCRHCAVVHRRRKNAEPARAWKKRNPAKCTELDSCLRKKVKSEEYRKQNTADCRRRTASWVKINRDRKLETDRLWYENNKPKKQMTDRLWQQSNPDKVAAKEARYRAAKLRACPSWADHAKIDAIYAECQRISRETGILHHVDH